MKTPVLAVLCLLLGACASTPRAPNAYEVAAGKLVGQPAAKAAMLFGPPTHGVAPSGNGGFYAWDNTRISVSNEMEFVQTGSEFVGRTQVGQLPGGHGVAGAPIFQDQYRPTGYYQNVKQLDYLCNITVFTNAQNIITKASVIGCNPTKRGI